MGTHLEQIFLDSQVNITPDSTPAPDIHPGENGELGLPPACFSLVPVLQPFMYKQWDPLCPHLLPRADPFQGMLCLPSKSETAYIRYQSETITILCCSILRESSIPLLGTLGAVRRSAHSLCPSVHIHGRERLRRPWW